MGEVIYGIVFGKQKIEGDGGNNPAPGIDRFSDDVHHLPPNWSIPTSWELPCDSEPTNEPA